MICCFLCNKKHCYSETYQKRDATIKAHSTNRLAPFTNPQSARLTQESEINSATQRMMHLCRPLSHADNSRTLGLHLLWWTFHFLPPTVRGGERQTCTKTETGRWTTHRNSSPFPTQSKPYQQHIHTEMLFSSEQWPPYYEINAYKY